MITRITGLSPPLVTDSTVFNLLVILG